MRRKKGEWRRVRQRGEREKSPVCMIPIIKCLLEEKKAGGERGRNKQLWIGDSTMRNYKGQKKNRNPERRALSRERSKGDERKGQRLGLYDKKEWCTRGG